MKLQQIGFTSVRYYINTHTKIAMAFSNETKIKFYVVLITAVVCSISSIITFSSTDANDIYITKIELLSRSQFQQCSQKKIKRASENLFYDRNDENDVKKYGLYKRTFFYPSGQFCNDHIAEYFVDQNYTHDDASDLENDELIFIKNTTVTDISKSLAPKKQLKINWDTPFRQNYLGGVWYFFFFR